MQWFRRDRHGLKQSTTAELVQDLASDNPNVVESAAYELQGRLDGVEPLLNLVPALGAWGRLNAIEVIESWPVEVARQATHPSVGDVMLPLLRDDSDVVREWAAGVLGWIGESRAVTEIEAALHRSRAAGVPAGWTEPVSYRRALRDLGAREQLLPMGAAALSRQDPSLGLHWAVSDLIEVLDLLASEGQVVLYVLGWWPEGGHWYWEGAPEYEADLGGPWPEVVARVRAESIRAARAWSPRDGTVAVLEWIDETDR